MSSSLSEGKENADVANEFAKRDKATTSSSILKPSQRENLLQLTPKKPPKVSFKNTPISHHPACYRAELPQSVLDTWEEIRCLDEVENWTERTQIVTKEDHQLHIEFAIEFLEEILISLPDLKTSKNQIVEAKTEDNTEKLPSKADKSIESQSKCLSGPASSGSSDLKTVGCIMDGMDVDFAGPLDPAIASLNSLLKAGEDEEKAFSPIGSERTSPDCDTMVTSDDIEKLLAPHDMPDDGEIPSLELFHGNRIDALMDSRFSATSLDEVTAKLDQLRMSTFPFEKEIENVEDDFSLSVENTPTVLINKPQEEKGIKDEKDEIENALPIKRRSPKETAAAKINATDSSGEEKETFKKPLPPKPWKQKKKKVPQQQDPFDVVFVDNKAGEEASTKENSSASLNSMLADEKPQTSVTDNAVLTDGLTGSGIALNAVTVKPTLPRTDGDGEEKMKMNDDTFGVTQDDFGLGNDDFQSSGDAFSLQLDYLEKFGNTGNLDRLSALARQSLYVKFDPLVKGSSPDQGLRRMKADAANSKRAPANLEDLLLMNTPPDQQAHASKLTAIKESEDKPTSSSLTGIDRLLTFSPEAQTSSVVAGQNSKPTQHKEDRSSTKTTADNLEDFSLVQPLLYSKTDIEAAVKKERETLIKETHKESAFREMEIQEIQNKLQTQVETNEKLRRENDELRTVMNEYERTMAEMIETSEKNKNVSDESNNEIAKERDQLQADLNSVEAAFSDLHRRYEKLKGVLENFKKNEEILKKATLDYQEKLRKSGEKYQMLKKHAEEKIETANIEINRVRRSNDSEMAVMRAALKKEQNKSVSLEQAVQQKINENIELTAICDELIQRASGAK